MAAAPPPSPAPETAAKGSRKVIYAGLFSNLLVAATKLGAAVVTQSVAMLSEAIHSLVDTSNELLLLYGAHRASRPPDADHPLGHGREVYFWSFIVSIMVFTLGACVSLAIGIHHMIHPEAMERPIVNYVVLGCAALFEGSSWWVALREFRKRKGGRGYVQAAEETKDPSTMMVFLEDSAALVGIAIALAGTAAAHLLDEPLYDGVASIGIGILLAVVAWFLARENKKLLIGEGASPWLVDSVGQLARTEPGVAHFNGMLSVHLAPREVVMALSIDFDESLKASQVSEVVARLEKRIREKHPEVALLLVKPQAPKAYKKAHAAWMAPREPEA
jgi:cation diffusion facilitator family transporter